MKVAVRAGKQSASDDVAMLTNPIQSFARSMPMKTDHFLFGALLTLLPLFGYAESKSVEHVYPRVCKGGTHMQPGGEFAVYVFCDEAEGSNIAVMHVAPGDSEFSKWPIDQRFWQGQAWAKDVDSIGWVPHKNFLVVATSEIYGEGAIFLLDLVNQTSKVLSRPPACGASIVRVTDESVTAKLYNCKDGEAYKTVSLEFDSTLRDEK